MKAFRYNQYLKDLLQADENNIKILRDKLRDIDDTDLKDIDYYDILKVVHALEELKERIEELDI